MSQNLEFVVFKLASIPTQTSTLFAKGFSILAKAYNTWSAQPWWHRYFFHRNYILPTASYFFKQHFKCYAKLIGNGMTSCYRYCYPCKIKLANHRLQTIAKINFSMSKNIFLAEKKKTEKIISEICTSLRDTDIYQFSVISWHKLQQLQGC